MLLNKDIISNHIRDFYPNMPIFIYNSTDSTNTRAKELADGGYEGDAVFIANEQTAGRGRIGRRFISEGGKGLYLSILLGKEKSKASGVAITTYMAVMASRVLEELTALDPKIKWVNDIFIGSKKLSGILTEGKTNSETGSLDYTVCGIGINILSQCFDDEVRKIATSIEDETGEKTDANVLASKIIKEFFDNLHLVGSLAIADEYRRRSFIIGKCVDVVKPNETYKATVLKITDDCALLIKKENGEEEILFTGEISIKPN